MRDVDVKQIEQLLHDACGRIAFHYEEGIVAAMKRAAESETSARAQAAIKMLMENACIADQENIPICQDTGMAIVYLTAGQEVHFINGSLNEAIQEGIRSGYRDAYLRASIVKDPLFERKNTSDNTPAMIHYEITEGDRVTLGLMEKGFGSENKSAVKMLTPADGENGVIQFVLETVRKAGPNACPPFVIGVGIGSDFEGCCELSKKALMRPLSEANPDRRYAQLERRLLEEVNHLKIGPMGLHGNTTALGVHVEQAPTHIAGLPAAVNMCCHACRHWSAVL